MYSKTLTSTHAYRSASHGATKVRLAEGRAGGVRRAGWRRRNARCTAVGGVGGVGGGRDSVPGAKLGSAKSAMHGALKALT
jgi:hypothetical protein